MNKAQIIANQKKAQRKQDIVVVSGPHQLHIADYIQTEMQPACWGNFPTEIVTVEEIEDENWWKENNFNKEETRVMSFIQYMEYFVNHSK